MSFTDLTATQTFAMFPTAPRNANAVRSGLKVLGHLTLLVLNLGFIAATMVSSIYLPYHPMYSGPAITGAWIVLGFVAWGVLRGSFRPAAIGALYGAGLAAFMWLGDSLPLGAAWLFGSGYLGTSFLLAAVTGVIWVDSRLRGHVQH